ncbi:hypothetical protein A374_18554 [Fictibacillus macauensis ZFHKF-1]|uniref:Sporulation protein n=1 Tax=Fictibacillus macauensis ZFHKF-1 TaxID=1196324 RepID=I8AE40_9BACL|nr:hypothetical protein [Fictibacillus macauensis]EIT83857.1 hypothetical protein A374_18554 [Fictibacillus macauensis ZFHKF-1]
MPIKKLTVCACSMLLLTACSFTNKDHYEPTANESPKNMRDNLWGHGVVNYHATKNNPNFNYSYETNKNPHDYQKMNTARFDLSDDQDKIREQVVSISGINPQIVTINGNYAHIHINVPSSYSNGKVAKMRRDILHGVNAAVPRYKYSVTMDEV